MRHQAVLFDLDGTLINTAPDFYWVMQQLAEQYSTKPLSYADVHATVSHGSRALIKKAFNFDENSDDFQQARQQLLDLYENHLAVDSHLYEGLDKLIVTLNAKKITWGVVTNKPRLYAEKVLAGLALSNHCGSLVCPDDVSKTKPDPEPLFLAAKEINIAPEKIIYVGDHKRDIDAGNAADMYTITAAYGYIDKDDSPQEWQADCYCETSQEVSNKLAELLL